MFQKNFVWRCSAEQLFWKILQYSKNTFFMLFPWGEYVKEKNHEMANHESRVFVIVKREEWQQVHAFL